MRETAAWRSASAFWNDSFCCGDRWASGAKRGPFPGPGEEGALAPAMPLRPPPEEEGGLRAEEEGEEVSPSHGPPVTDPFFVGARSAACQPAGGADGHQEGLMGVAGPRADASDMSAGGGGLQAFGHLAAGAIGVSTSVAAPPQPQTQPQPQPADAPHDGRESQGGGSSSAAASSGAAARSGRLSQEAALDAGSAHVSVQQIHDVMLDEEREKPRKGLPGHTAKHREHAKGEDEWSEIETDSELEAQLDECNAEMKKALKQEQEALRKHYKKGDRLAKDIKERLASFLGDPRPSSTEASVVQSMPTRIVSSMELPTRVASSMELTMDSEASDGRLTRVESKVSVMNTESSLAVSGNDLPQASLKSDDSDDEITREWNEQRRTHGVKMLQHRPPQVVDLRKVAEQQAKDAEAKKGRHQRPRETREQRAMRKEISAYQEIVHDRMNRLGGDAPERDSKVTYDPAEAVVSTVLKYHQHCQVIGKYKAFSAEDEDTAEPEKKELQKLITRLEDTDPRIKREKAPPKKELDDD